MLESDQLDDTRYRELYDRALASISTLAPGWTDMRAHDPGITILETMTLLSDMQNYTCNLVGEAHLLKYLELLGAEPENIRPARAFVTVRAPERETALPSGSLFWAEGLPFETQKVETLCANRLQAVLSGPEGRLRECTALLEDRIGRGVPVLHGEGETLCLGFERPFEAGREAALFVRVEPCPERRPPSPAAPPLADLLWETWDGGGWHAAAVRDETAALLCSGFLRFKPLAPMEPLELGGKRLYFLRVRLAGRGYDLPPVLKRLRLNVLPLVQQRTLAETVELAGPPPWTVHTRLGREGVARLFVPGPEGTWREFTGGVHWTDKPDGGRLLQPDGGSPERARLCCMDPEYRCQTALSGVTSQRVPLKLSGVRPESLRLMLRGGDGLWRECAVFLHPPGGETVPSGCLFLPESGELLFGDGRDFAIPAPAKEGLLLAGLAVTLGAGGNAAARSIQSGPAACVNEEPAEGGKNPETAAEALAALRERMARPLRAVTDEDFRRIAMETPGLALHKAAAFPLSRLRRGGAGMAVVVKPCGEGRPPLSPWMRERVREQLEPARLLTVRVEVLGPRYLPIRVLLRASLWENGPAQEQELARLVKELTDGVEGSLGFGEAVSHARLFSALSALGFVRAVEELRLDAAGAAGRRLRNGDLQPEPDTLPWLESCRLVLGP